MGTKVRSKYRKSSRRVKKYVPLWGRPQAAPLMGGAFCVCPLVVFHILGGTISSVGHKKEDLLINSLVERVKKDKIEEIILATSATVEGQTTAFYIQDSLSNIDVKITKLAQGLPVGGEIENLDDGTLLSAFKNRSKINSNSS